MASGHPVFEGRGIGSDPDWLPEDSYLILGMPRTDAILQDLDQYSVKWY
jgi:hypothetical protein